MKGRVLALGLLLALFAAFLTRGAGPGPEPQPIAAPPSIPTAPVEAPVAVPSSEPARDPFRYFDEVDSFRTGPPPREPRLEVSVAPTPPPLRLLGFVRRGEGLLAALSLHGIVITAGVGESAEGHLVLSVDEDAGVRLRDPDGEEIVLVPQSE